MYNLEGKIGGDAELSPRGEMYAKKLPSLVLESVGVCTFPSRSSPSRVPWLINIGQSPFDCLDFNSSSHYRHCPSPS